MRKRGKENEDQRIKRAAENSIRRLMDDIAETVSGYENDFCLDNEAELNEAMSNECNWYMPTEQYIF